MKKLTLLLCSVVIVTLGGCSTQKFVSDTSMGYKAMDRWDHFFFWGIGQEKTNYVERVCGSKENLVRIETEDSFLSGLLTGLTYGIYSPRVARIYCRRPDSAKTE